MKVFKCDECRRMDGICLFTETEGEEPHSCACGNGEKARWYETDDFEIVEKVKEKKTELMTFGDAAKVMSVGESFKIGTGKGGEVLTMVHNIERDMEVFSSNLHDEYVLFDPDLLNKKGQIINAVPVVLSVDQIVDITFEKYGDLDQREYQTKLVNAGEKKQWRNHKELRELLEEWNASETVLKHYTERVEQALKNLKPLGEE